jgi:osmotically inducible lipoprotein OsmB
MRTTERISEDAFMRRILIAGAVICATFLTISTAASADERKLTGAAIGAGVGALIAGPAGAVGGVIAGYWLEGPRVTGRSYRTCWYDRDGRHCRWR